MEDLTVTEIKDMLIALDKKIQRIENNNPDFLESKSWNKYRRRQDVLYDLLRSKQCLSNQQNKNNTHTRLLRYSEAEKTKDLLQ